MKKDYMTRLERAARWRLSSPEAEDVIADYHDIVGTPPRSEKELLRDLGRPHDVVKLLDQPGKYRIWLAMFAFMVISILALVTDQLFVPVAFWVPLLSLHQIDIFFCYILSILGTIAALVWFRCQGKKMEHLPRAVLILLALLLAFAACVVLFYWTCFQNPDAFLEIWERVPAWLHVDGRPFYIPQLVICYICPVIVAIGIYSLIKARTEDRRWAAIYVLAMAVVLISRMFLAWTLLSMVMIDYEAAWQHLMLRFAVAAVAGFIGTGVALC